MYRLLQVAPRPVMEAVCIFALLSVIIVKLLNGTSSAYFITTVSVFAAETMDKPVASFSYTDNKLSISGKAMENAEVTIYVVNPGFTKDDIGLDNGALQNFRKVSADKEGKYAYEQFN